MARKVLYWIAVLAISLVLVVVVVLLLAGRDRGSISRLPTQDTSFANTTIRWDAL